jgi:hypothetical protein
MPLPSSWQEGTSKVPIQRRALPPIVLLATSLPSTDRTPTAPVWLNCDLAGLVEPQDAPRRVDVKPGVLFTRSVAAHWVTRRADTQLLPRTRTPPRSTTLHLPSLRFVPSHAKGHPSVGRASRKARTVTSRGRAEKKTLATATLACRLDERRCNSQRATRSLADRRA